MTYKRRRRIFAVIRGTSKGNENVKEIKNYNLYIGKGIILILIVLFCLQMFSVPSDSTQDFDTVMQETTKNIELSQMIKQDNQTIRRNLGLDPESFENIVYYKFDDVMQANEYVIVQFKEDSQSEQFKESIDTRIQEQHNLYDGYAPDQVQLLDRAIISIQANYALYVVDPSGSQMETQFLDSL